MIFLCAGFVRYRRNIIGILTTICIHNILTYSASPNSMLGSINIIGRIISGIKMKCKSRHSKAIVNILLNLISK